MGRCLVTGGEIGVFSAVSDEACKLYGSDGLNRFLALFLRIRLANWRKNRKKPFGSRDREGIREDRSSLPDLESWQALAGFFRCKFQSNLSCTRDWSFGVIWLALSSWIIEKNRENWIIRTLEAELKDEVTTRLMRLRQTPSSDLVKSY